MRLLWGTLIEDQLKDETVRRDFDANEEFDMDKNKVNRVQTKIEGHIYYALNRLLMLTLMAITVTSFYLTNTIYKGLLSGVINGAIAGGTDFIY